MLNRVALFSKISKEFCSKIQKKKWYISSNSKHMLWGGFPNEIAIFLSYKIYKLFWILSKSGEIFGGNFFFLLFYPFFMNFLFGDFCYFCPIHIFLLNPICKIGLFLTILIFVILESTLVIIKDAQDVVLVASVT